MGSQAQVLQLRSVIQWVSMVGTGCPVCSSSRSPFGAQTSSFWLSTCLFLSAITHGTPAAAKRILGFAERWKILPARSEAQSTAGGEWGRGGFTPQPLDLLWDGADPNQLFPQIQPLPAVLHTEGKSVLLGHREKRFCKGIQKRLRRRRRWQNAGSQMSVGWEKHPHPNPAGPQLQAVQQSDVSAPLCREGSDPMGTLLSPPASWGHP